MINSRANKPKQVSWSDDRHTYDAVTTLVDLNCRINQVNSLSMGATETNNESKRATTIPVAPDSRIKQVNCSGMPATSNEATPNEIATSNPENNSIQGINLNDFFEYGDNCQSKNIIPQSQK